MMNAIDNILPLILNFKNFLKSSFSTSLSKIQMLICTYAHLDDATVITHQKLTLGPATQ